MRPTSGRRRRQSGVAIILLSLMLCTILLPMIGLAFDLTIMYLVKAKLSGAVDAAVLAAGRSLTGSQTLAAQQTQVTNIALDFLNANMPQGYWGTSATPTVLTPTANIVTQDTTNMRILVTLAANVQVPTIFMQFIQPTVTVAASAQAARRYLRMMIVLDRSSSMSGDPIAQLKLAVSNSDPSNPGFVQDFFEGQDDLGLVILGASAIVAYPPRDPTIAGGGGNGPDSNFKTIANPNIPTLVNMMVDESNTATAEAVTLAYKELQKNPQPLYYNVIVLFTDGLPNGITAGWNGAAPAVFYSGDTGNTATTVSSINTASTCKYKKYSDFTNIPSHQIVGSIAQWDNYNNRDTDIRGIYAPMMTTKYPWTGYSSPGQDVENYVSDPSLGAKGAADNNPVGTSTSNPAGWADNCSFITGGSEVGKADNDIGSFPAGDLYGNALLTNDYEASLNFHLVGGTLISSTDVKNAYQIGNVSWNAAYQASVRIRHDTTLKPVIYCIGYTGDGGVDHALLKRMTNTNQGFTTDTWSTATGGDPQGPYPSTAYDPTSTSGMYYDAGPGGIAAAFQEVRSQILALAK
jgi:Flp pilus assembly protein TadG